MQEAERRREAAVQVLCSEANAKLTQAEAVAQVRHNEALANLEHEAQTKDSLPRAEREQRREALLKYPQEVTASDHKLVTLRTTLKEEYAATRQSTINFLKEEFAKSQGLLKNEMTDKMTMVESELRGQNEELQDQSVRDPRKYAWYVCSHEYCCTYGRGPAWNDYPVGLRISYSGRRPRERIYGKKTVRGSSRTAGA